MFKRSDETAAPSSAQPVTIPPNGVRKGDGVSINGQAGAGSVIGRDLVIMGSGLKIVSEGLLQIDGDVQGDVICTKIIIGHGGKVTGLLSAEEIIVEGAVYGTIRAIKVVLAATAVVEGDVYHQSFALQQGAGFEGRSRRVQDRAELLPDFSALSGRG